MIRTATVEDFGIIAAHRVAMFRDMGHADEAALDAMNANFIPWVRRKLESGEYVGWFALAEDGEIVAGVGLWLMDWPPHMVGPGMPRANILNVYTRPDWRRKGLARELIRKALDWCREKGIRTVILHASEEGRGVYAEVGFQPTNEMRLQL